MNPETTNDFNTPHFEINKEFNEEGVKGWNYKLKIKGFDYLIRALLVEDNGEIYGKIDFSAVSSDAAVGNILNVDTLTQIGIDGMSELYKHIKAVIAFLIKQNPQIQYLQVNTSRNVFKFQSSNEETVPTLKQEIDKLRTLNEDHFDEIIFIRSMEPNTTNLVEVNASGYRKVGVELCFSTDQPHSFEKKYISWSEFFDFLSDEKNLQDVEIQKLARELILDVSPLASKKSEQRQKLYMRYLERLGFDLVKNSNGTLRAYFNEKVIENLNLPAAR